MTERITSTNLEINDNHTYSYNKVRNYNDTKFIKRRKDHYIIIGMVLGIMIGYFIGLITPDLELMLYGF